ncbi:hypothetical protein PMIN06_001179 [Paraphaeosphaeria minitans]
MFQKPTFTKTPRFVRSDRCPFGGGGEWEWEWERHITSAGHHGTRTGSDVSAIARQLSRAPNPALRTSRAKEKKKRKKRKNCTMQYRSHGFRLGSSGSVKQRC